jgi:hypothetical protein
MPSPHQVFPFSSMDEPGNLAIRVTLKDLTRARLPGDKEHVPRFNLQTRRRSAGAATNILR